MTQTRHQSIENLFEQMNSVFRASHGGRGHLFKDYGLGRPQAALLFYIAAHPDGVSVKDLAASMHVTSGAITQFLDGLVAKGLLERLEDEHDRRVARVKLSAEAQSKLKDLRHSHLKRIEGMFVDLN